MTMGPMIDGVIGIPQTQPRTNTSTSTSSGAKKTYVFRGRTYYTYAAYQRAVNEYNAAQAAAARAAADKKSAEERARAEARARVAASNAANQQKAIAEAAEKRRIQLAQSAAAQAAARRAADAARQRAILQNAARVRAEAEAARIAEQAKQREQLKLAATRRAEETRMQAQMQEQAKIQAAQARAVEARQQANRNTAYNRLTQNTHVATQALALKGKPSPWQAAREAYIKQQQAQEVGLSAQPWAPGLGFLPVDDPEMNTIAGRRRQQLMNDGRRTGDYKGALDFLDEQSRKSGGLYHDRKLEAALYTTVIVPAYTNIYQPVIEAFTEWEAANEADDRERMIELADEIAENREEFLRLFGESMDTPGVIGQMQDRLHALEIRRTAAILRMIGINEEEDARRIANARAAAQTGEGPHLSEYEGRLPIGVDNVQDLGYRQRGRSRVPLTYQDQVYDPVTGRVQNITRYGLEAYIAREQARQQELQREQFDRAILQTKINKYRGSSLTRGQTVESLTRQNQQLNLSLDTAAEVMGIDRQALNERLTNIISMPDGHVRNIAMENILREVDDAWSAGQTNARVREGSQFGFQRDMRSQYLKDKQEFMGPIVYAFTGQRDGVNYEGVRVPAIGHILTSWQDLVNSGVNWAGDMRFGSDPKNAYVYRADFFSHEHFNMWGPVALPFKEQRLRENDPEIQEAYRRYLKDMATGNPEVQARAQRVWREIWLTGNVGFVADVLVDPLNFAFVLGKPLQIARAASAATGGIRGKGFAGFGEWVGKAGEYALPHSKEYGWGWQHLRNDRMWIDVSRELGVDPRTFLNIADQDAVNLLRSHMLGAEVIGGNRTFQKLADALTTQGVSREQLLNYVQQRMPALMKKHGVLHGDPFITARMMDDVERASRFADSAARTSEATIDQQLRAAIREEALYAQRLSRGDIPGAERIAQAERAHQRAIEIERLVEKQIAAVDEMNVGMTRARLRATGTPIRLARRRKAINEKIARLSRGHEATGGPNATTVRRLREDIERVNRMMDQVQLDPYMTQKQYKTTMAALRGKLRKLEEELLSVPGLELRAQFNELMAELRQVNRGIEQARNKAGIFKTYNTPGRIAEWVSGRGRHAMDAGGDVRQAAGAPGKITTKGTRTESIWGSGGQARLGRGLYLSLDDTRWGRRVEPIRVTRNKGGTQKPGSSGGSFKPGRRAGRPDDATEVILPASQEPMAHAFFRLSRNADIVEIRSLAEYKRVLKKYGVKYTGKVEDAKALSDAVRKAGHDGIRITNMRTRRAWSGEYGRKLVHDLGGDQMIIFDPKKVGKFIDEAKYKPVSKTGLEQKLAKARIATKRAADDLAQAKRDYLPNRLAKPRIRERQNVLKSEKEVKVKVTDPETGQTKILKDTIPVEETYDQVIGSLNTLTTEYKTLTDRASELMDIVVKGEARPSDLRAAFKELNKTVEKMKHYEDTTEVVKGVAGDVVSRKPGILSERLQSLGDFHTRSGGSPLDPAFNQGRWKALREDALFLGRKAALTRSRLVRAKSQKQIDDLTRELASLADAREGLRAEARVLSRGRLEARKFYQADPERLSGVFRPQQVAHIADTAADRAFGVSLDFNAQLFRTTDVWEVPGYIARNAREARRVREITNHLRLTNPKTGKTYSVGSTRAGRELIEFVGEGDLTFWEAWLATEAAMTTRAGRAQWQTLNRRLRAEIMQHVDRTKFTGRRVKGKGTEGKPTDLYRAVQLEHVVDNLTPATYAKFKDADAIIAERIRNARGFVAEGQLRKGRNVARSQEELRTPARPRSQEANATRYDSDPRVVIAKMRAEKDIGMSMFAYDELRFVFSRPRLKEVTGEALAKQARAAAKAKGTTFNEEMIRLRKARADLEGRRAFEEYATRPGVRGLPMERIARMFEEEHLLDYLSSPAKPKSITRFQRRALENGFEEVSGFKHSNETMRVQWLTGGMKAPKGTRLLTPEEFASIPDHYRQKWGSVPVRIVDDPELITALELGGNVKAQTLVYDGTETILRNPRTGKTWKTTEDLTPGIYITKSGLDDVTTLYHEAFHTAWFDPSQAHWREMIERELREIGTEQQWIEWLGMGAYTADDVAVHGMWPEIAAEFYALGARGAPGYGEAMTRALAKIRARTPDSLYGKTRSTVTRPDGRKVRGRDIALSPTQRRAFQQEVILGHMFDKMDRFVASNRKMFGIGPDAPPLHNRTAMREWAESTGRWDPKTGEDIRAGRRVWSMEDEGQYYLENFGYRPPWTDPDVMRVLLRDQRAYQRAFREWGFIDGAYDDAADMFTDSELANALAWGKGDLKPKRSFDELRDWYFQRYGRLVADEQGRFHSMPWLMKADETEYLPWIRHHLSPAGRKKFQQQLEAARPRMSAELQYQYWDDAGRLRAHSLDIDPTLIGAKGSPEKILAALDRAMVKAIERRLARMKRQSSFGVSAFNDPWLHQEIMEFSIDVARELYKHQAWRGLFRGRTVLQQVLHMAGWQRMVVTADPAFPIMNLLESYGYKRVILALTHNGGLPIGADGARWAERIRTLADIGDGSVSRLFGREGKASWGVRTFDGNLSAASRLKGTVDDIVNIGTWASEQGENMLRLDFARVMYGKAYTGFKRMGKSEEVADLAAKVYAKRMNSFFFETMGDSPWLQALNQAVPFFSYRFQQFTLAVRMSVMHPYVPLTLAKLQEAIIDHNRDYYIEKNGTDVGFDRDDRRNHQLWFDMGDGLPYMIDLSDVSDWTRAMQLAITTFMHGGALTDMLQEVVRIPHPLQKGIWAILANENTPWGKPGDLRELFFFVDLFHWMRGDDYEDPRHQRDLLQRVSQLMFFKGFGKWLPGAMEAGVYFGLHDLGKTDEAFAYLDAHPGIRAYFDMLEPFRNPRWDPFKAGRDLDRFKNATFMTLLNPAGRREYIRAKQGYDALVAEADAEIYKYARQPWSAEYKAAKRQKTAMILAYHLENPILMHAWGLLMTPAEFANLRDRWMTDSRTDSYFQLITHQPKRSDFQTDRLYFAATVEFNEFKKAWLAAHPDVVERIASSENALEQAWKDHVAQWSELIEIEAKINLRLAEEKEKDEADRDPELMDSLYSLKKDVRHVMDAEGIAHVYAQHGPGKMNRVRLGQAFHDAARGMGADPMKGYFTLPGMADYRYGNASPDEQAQMREDVTYYREIGKLAEMVAESIASGAEFSDETSWWHQLKERGLLERYLRENPHKQFDYEYAVAIGGIVNTYGQRFWSGMMMPENKWILDEYLKRNPEKWGMYNYMKGLDRIWKTIGSDFRRFYSELAKDPWLEGEYFRRNPEKAKRGQGSVYGQGIMAIVNRVSSGQEFYAELAKNPWLEAEYFRRNPDKVAAIKANNEYFGWMQRWTAALRAGNFDLSRQIFDSMPEWVKDRYYQNRQRPAGSGGAGGGTGSRRTFVQNLEYRGYLEGWINLLKQKDYAAATEHFNNLPLWVKERYWGNNPEKRAKMQLSQDMLARAADFFLMAPEEQPRFLKNNPDFANWLNQYGGDEAARRGLLTAIFEAIPKTNQWLRRTFRERHPEVFSEEAAGERKIKSVERRLLENPSMVPYYERALKEQNAAYLEQLKRDEKMPRQWSMERVERMKKKRRRRVARFHSTWAKHRNLRRYQESQEKPVKGREVGQPFRA